MEHASPRPSVQEVDSGALPRGSRERLSVVLAVKNEARQLEECLDCLAFADEIVIVDMESSDGTLLLCRQAAEKWNNAAVQAGASKSKITVTVSDGGPHHLIHANKNIGIDKAAGPWILSLDADERLTPELRDEILHLLESPPPEFVAFALPFTHYFFGKYLRHGGFRGHLVRLFRKGSCRYPEDRAHSTPVVEGKVGELKHLVVHFNHRRIADFIRKMNLYTSSDARLMARHGKGGLRNRAVPRHLAWQLLRAPLCIFWNRYVRHGGFRDGVHGLVAAALLAFYQFVEYAKLWELKHVSPPPEEEAAWRPPA